MNLSNKIHWACERCRKNLNIKLWPSAATAIYTEPALTALVKERKNCSNNVPNKEF